MGELTWEELKKKYPDAEEVSFLIPFEDSRKDNLKIISELLTDNSDHEHKWIIYGSHHNGCHAYCEIKGCDEELEHDELERRVNSFIGL